MKHTIYIVLPPTFVSELIKNLSFVNLYTGAIRQMYTANFGNNEITLYTYDKILKKCYTLWKWSEYNTSYH